MTAPLAGYIRVSHIGRRDENDRDSFHSIDEQEAEIHRFATARALHVEMLPPDLDAKGSDPSRRIFREAIDGTKEGRYSGIVVAYISRAGRDLRLMLDLWDEIEKAGGAVYCARESIDASTTSGRLQRNILASIAQAELEERRDGFEKSVAGAVAQGIWKQRQTPRGYDRHEQIKGHPLSRRLVPNAQREDVTHAFDDRAGGMAITALADRLHMTPSGVRQMLKNRVYLGELSERGYVNPKAHEPLVTLEQFESVQSTMARPSRRAVSSDPAMLAGLVHCSGCGHVMSRGGSERWLSYTCAVRHSGARCPEPAAVTVALLDAHVERIAIAELAKLTVVSSDGKSVEHARTALNASEAELGAYLAAVSAVDVGAKAFGAGARQRREAVDAARDQLRAALVLHPATPALSNGAAAWANLGARERNILLRALLLAVVVKRSGGRGSRIPLYQRVRVLAAGSDIALPARRGGEASGIVPIPLPDLHDPRVLRVPSGEDHT